MKASQYSTAAADGGTSVTQGRSRRREEYRSRQAATQFTDFQRWRRESAIRTHAQGVQLAPALMLWILISLFFCWCAFHEIHSSMVAPPGFDTPLPLSKPYLAIVLTLAGLFAWPPVHTWHFERFLSRRATELADQHTAHVHCNTVWDTMLDPAMLASGHADPDTGEIGIQHPWCGTLSSYLSHPGRATAEELASLNLFTHESMHVRGERNEARTECQAVQRNYRAAKLLGVPDGIAKRSALDYYNTLYKERANQGIMQAEYYSAECAPGKALDEHLSDSTWAPL